MVANTAGLLLSAQNANQKEILQKLYGDEMSGVTKTVDNNADYILTTPNKGDIVVTCVRNGGENLVELRLNRKDAKEMGERLIKLAEQEYDGNLR